MKTTTTERECSVAAGVVLDRSRGSRSGSSRAPPSALSIHPLFFEGPGGFGFSASAVAGMEPSASADPSDPWILAGARALAAGARAHRRRTISPRSTRIPRDRDARRARRIPSSSIRPGPFRTRPGAPIASGYLVFTKIDIDRRYPGLLAGLDGDLLKIVEYSASGTEYFFGAMALPSLGVGQSVDLTVRYVVAGALDYDAESNAFVLPRLGIAGLLVPEPMPLMGVALGLLALAGARARARRGPR